MFRFLFAIVTLLVTNVFAQDFTTYRLPNNTIPETFDISIRMWIDENNGTFTGSVRIGILATESTDYIRLHHRVEELRNVAVLSANEQPIAIGEVWHNQEFSFLTIPIAGSNLTQGTRYYIDIDYVGFMNSARSSAFHRSSHVVNGTWIPFVSTQFAPTFARYAFPCYDEPQFKANYTIRLTHTAAYSAISNMPVVSVTQNDDGSATTLFEETPKMSSYLVAFHVSELPHVTSAPPKRIPQRFFSRPDTIGTAMEALDTGERLIEALEDYVGIDFMLPKMDHIAVGVPPAAMENWGMITYDESALHNASTDFFVWGHLPADRTIAHELAHQWFGNLVTPSWWTFLWLSEGFATFFEYLGVDLIHPDWKIMDYFVVDNNQFVFRDDAFQFTQPMTRYVERPRDISFQFNNIAYNKAAAVIRMFWHAFGQETFMDGVTSYLRNHAYSNADEDDLFDAIAAAVRLDNEVILPPGSNVSTIMASWTRQPGFPLITVGRNYGDRPTQVTLTQQRYYSFPPVNIVSQTWWVPYNLVSPSNADSESTRVQGWIPNTVAVDINVNNLGADDFLLMNRQATGYYRIRYDDRNYRLISDAIIRNSSQFHSTDVAQLLGDAIEFYQTGEMSVRTVLDVLRVLEFRTDYVSWSAVLVFIFNINRDNRGNRNYPMWADFVRSLSEEMYDAIGPNDIPDEPILNKPARESIVHLACDMGSVHCRSDTTRLLRRHIELNESFHHNIRQVLSCASMRSASRTDFHTLWNLSQTSDNFLSRHEIHNMLSCSTSRRLLNEFVRSVYNTSMYSEPEQSFVIGAVLENGGNLGIGLTLEFLIENYETFGSRFARTLTIFVSNAEHVERFKVYQDMLLDANLIQPGEAAFNLVLIERSVRWLKEEGEEINTWLEENFA